MEQSYCSIFFSILPCDYPHPYYTLTIMYLTPYCSKSAAFDNKKLFKSKVDLPK